MTSLNPAMTIGRQMSEVMTEHLNMDKKEARERSIDMLAKVGIADPGKRIDDYPPSAVRRHAPACHGGHGHAVQP